MRTEILFHDQMIPVRFISSDQKAIPLLIQVVESCRIQPEETHQGFMYHINLIEVVGNNAILYSSSEEERIQLSLY